MVDFARLNRERALAKKEDRVASKLQLKPDTAAASTWTPPKVVLAGRQVMALEAAMAGKNLFITGPGGVGKTAVVNQIVSELNRARRQVAVTASTGIAAVSIGGMTIHSTIKLGIARSREEAMKRMGPDTISKAQEYLYHCKVLLIDEISMLTGDYLDMLDWWLGLVMENRPGQYRPFGGLQVILVGDFLQLPPVIKESDKVAKTYGFESDVWQKAGIEEVYLNESWRQADPEMFRHLCKIRRGIVDADTVEFFRPCLTRSLTDPTKLCATNSAAYDENDMKLRELPGDAETYQATYKGHEAWQNALRDNCIADDEVALKVGAPVIFIKNNYDAGYMNGERGVVSGFENGSPIITRADGPAGRQDFAIEPTPWEMRDASDRLLAQMFQIPVKLAYAVTMHKSQGMTLDNVHVDLAGCFERGQAYVALSRARRVEGLSLSVLPSPANVRASGKVVRYYKELAQKMRAKESTDG